MKRLHVHVSVDNLEESVRFYSALFGAEPVKRKEDYAKWLVDDPSVNFAISTRLAGKGVDHFGIQVDEEAELAEVRGRIAKAEMKTFDEGETTCCYAKADKTWVVDPAGLAWEAYRNMADAETYGREREAASTEKAGACCAPKTEKARGSLGETVDTKKKAGACC